MNIEQQINRILTEGVPVKITMEKNTMMWAYGLFILGIVFLYLLLQLISRS